MAASENYVKNTKPKPRKSRYNFNISDEDPLSSVANLFDVAMMFAVTSLILAMFSTQQALGLLNTEDFTVLKNPGKANMEIINKKGIKIEKYKMSKEESGGEGERMGVCYKLANGEVVYIPEGPVPADSTDAEKKQ